MWDMYEYTRNKHGENGMYNQKKVCGGGTKTLIPPTKNLTVRIAIGVVAMDGYMQHWYVYWMKFLLMKTSCRLYQ